MDRRRSLPRLVGCLLFAAFVTGTQAATISGKVVDLEGAPLADTMVTATNVATNFGGVAISDARGEFSIVDLPDGETLVAVQRSRYAFRHQTIRLERESERKLLLKAAGLSGFLARGGDLDDVPGAPGVTPPKRVELPKNYATVKVLFGTDRTFGDEGFGAGRGTLTLGTCEVSIPRDHRVGQLESPSWWKLEFHPDPTKHVVLLGTERLDATAFQALLSRRLADTPGVFVFVHGFNVSFHEAAHRTAQLAYDLPGLKVVPTFYSWPSNGETLAYVADGDQAQRAVRYLVEYLRLLANKPGVGKIHVIAHSMGNRVATAALKELALASDAAAAKIGEVVLVAPDIDAEIFREDIAPRIVKAGRRITLYASNHDMALAVSQKLHKFPRAGDLNDGVIVVTGIETIDASEVDTSLVGHSYFGDNRSVIADLYALLKSGTAPGDRFGMRVMEARGLKYWMFVP